MRIAVTGRHGQVARALIERAAGTACAIVPLARPTLDLTAPETIAGAVTAAAPDLLVSAAAYTDVNAAETDTTRAEEINARAPALLAGCAHALGIPIIHLSTDYVFDGTKRVPYVEDDPINPINAYGRTKSAGERAVVAAHPAHVILRTAWVYSPFGRNFVTTMLALARKQGAIRVVSDQLGQPTSALDIADAILAVARALTGKRGGPYFGTFHLAAAGDATWADFAAAIFAASAALGGPTAEVVPITSAEYPTSTRRPANSRLDCAKIARVYGISLPPWQSSLRACIARILESS
ncbi:MAG: dTDP-4-dehydrorhamnose reductase [Hyphomicrobiales bacterium]|nr:dTDP-4-dehydrorhamnose reductase [Hyphomicrobiales bacterium]